MTKHVTPERYGPAPLIDLSRTGHFDPSRRTVRYPAQRPMRTVEGHDTMRSFPRNSSPISYGIYKAFGLLAVSAGAFLEPYESTESPPAS